MILDIDEFFADSYPIVLSANTTLAEGENKQLDSQRLSNFFDTPMVIDEIRTQIVSPGGLEVELANFGGSVRLKLSLGGRYALTSTFVPVGCLGTVFDGGQLGYAGAQPGIYAPESLRGGFSERFNVGFFRWKLPRPLVCPVGMPLEAMISRQIEGLSEVYPGLDPLSINVAYAGRVSRKILPRGITIPIPYVGLFEHQFETAEVAISDQTDLYNPFQAMLNVQRLIARWQNIYLDAGLPLESTIGLDQRGIGGGESILFPSTRIRTFSGFDVTNNFAPGQAIFDANTRSLPINIPLEHGEGLEVTIDATAGIPSTGAQPDPTGSNTAFVSMIGWRNEDI